MFIARVSKNKLFLLLALAFGIGSSQFYSNMRELNLSTNGQAVAPAIWLGLIIVSSSWVIACFILVIVKVPRTLKINEKSISYTIGPSKKTKEIFWKDAVNITQTIWGIKLINQNKVQKVTLFLFTNKDTKQILDLISKTTQKSSEE